MYEWHSVVEGECIESIALAYGHHPGTVWNHPENKELRTLRGNPHVLVPGDRVFVPEKRASQSQVETNRSHVFRRKGVPARLRLKLEHDGEARSDVEYTLYVDDLPAVKGASDGDGMVDHWISPRAQNARLILETGEEYNVKLGRLRPLDDPYGQAARLTNLGYNCTVDNSSLESALLLFQRREELETTGICDAQTAKRLFERHGS